MLGFPKNEGLRSTRAGDRAAGRPVHGAAIDRKARKGERASDHAPVLATFADELTLPPLDGGALAEPDLVVRGRGRGRG